MLQSSVPTLQTCDCVLLRSDLVVSVSPSCSCFVLIMKSRDINTVTGINVHFCKSRNLLTLRCFSVQTWKMTGRHHISVDWWCYRLSWQHRIVALNCGRCDGGRRRSAASGDCCRVSSSSLNSFVCLCIILYLSNNMFASTLYPVAAPQQLTCEDEHAVGILQLQAFRVH